MTPDIEQIRARYAGGGWDGEHGWADDFEALLAVIDELTAQRDAVLALHKQIPAPNLEEYECCECLAPWPCETVRALTKAVR